MSALGAGDLARRLAAAVGSSLAEALAQRKGLEATPALIEQLRKRALGALRRLTDKGVIAAAGTDADGTTWRVA